MTRSAKWAAVRDIAPVMPWDEEWHESRLNEGEFWQWFAAHYGTLIVQRCWDLYWAGDEALAAGRRPPDAFADVPEVVHLWIAATNEDDRMILRQQWFNVMLLERKVYDDSVIAFRWMLLLPLPKEQVVRILYEMEYYRLNLRAAQGRYAIELDAMERDREAAA